jgi:hypothetical protein
MMSFFRCLVLIASYLGAMNLVLAQWVQVNNSTADLYTSFAIRGTTILAGTDGGGVYRSTDSGSTWNLANNGLTNLYVHTLAVGDSHFFAGTSGGMYVSTDNGSHWTFLNNGVSGTVSSFSKIGSNLFVGTEGYGVYVSTDNWAHGTAVNTGLANQRVTSLAVIGSILFAGTEFDGNLGSEGLYLSRNNGINWTAVNNGLQRNDINCLAAVGSKLFVDGTHLSTDTGKSWTSVSGDFYIQINDLTVSRKNLFLATVSGGVFLLRNDSLNWIAVGDDFTQQSVESIIADSTYLFAGTYYGGLWRRPLSEMIPIASEEWGFILDNDSANHGQLNFEKYSNRITVNGSWRSMYQGSIIQGVISSGTATVADTIISMTLHGTATNLDAPYGHQNSLFTESLGGSAYNGISSGTYSLDFSATGWPSNIQGSFDATRLNGSGVTGGVVTGVDKTGDVVPKAFTLSQNYPNPFNPTTSISFNIPSRSFVSLKVFDAVGRVVSTIVSEVLPAGNYTKRWNAIGMPSGVYFYRIQAGSFVQTKKLILLK